MSLPGSFVSTSAGRVFVHRGGRGEPLVLLHGWLMSHWYFRHIVAPLAREREVIAIDLPGHGESDRPSPACFGYDSAAYADVVAEVLDRLRLDRVDLLGASMGGGVALALAARRPERVGRLVLVDAAVYQARVAGVQAKLVQLPRVGPLLWKAGFRRARLASSLRTLAVRDARIFDDESIDYFWTRLARPGGHDASWACMRALATLPAESEEAAAVRAPTLVVWGDQDRLVPIGRGRKLARAIPHARLEIVPHSGHTPFLERPREFLRILGAFLAAHEAPARQRRERVA